MFETIEGGFLDIDVRIVGPDGKVIYQVKLYMKKLVSVRYQLVQTWFV